LQNIDGDVMGIITISRGSFSMGKFIAEKLADVMGYECVSREILLKASKEFDVPEVYLRSALQNAPSIFDRFKHGNKKYIAFIREAFLARIQKDNVVYHGFAGQFFTKEIPNILKIRVVADIDFRIKRVMENENVSEDEARKMLMDIDEERRKWSMYLYGIDTRSPDLYDIVLNIECLMVEGTVNKLTKMANLPCFQTTEETRKKIKNNLLAARAYSVLVNTYPEANVRCKDGKILVSIESSSSVEKVISEKIESMLKDIEGVKEVRTFVIPFDS
jgi:cytidylate kinase